jgi:sulfoxide reductase catalytic subunit YedY
MRIRIPRGWELPERAATPETWFHDRRRLMQTIAAGSILAVTAPIACSPGGGQADGAASGGPSATQTDTASLYPVERNGAYTIERPLTPETVASTYNNFYEYGSSKNIWEKAQALKTRPWEVRVDGMVEQEFTIAVDDLIARMPLEERLYRHRCVEAWSMTIAWSGFPMRALVEMARPLSSATYVRMETFNEPDMAPGQRQFWYPWPYVEGLTIAEATNELAFLVTGAYGKELPSQHGAPLRLAVPWKYGFKSGKSLVRFTFTDQEPVNFWQELQGSEYGFWANVNPEVAHPRWSQASERVLGTGDRVATLLFNGYGDFVADMYRGMDDLPLWR